MTSYGDGVTFNWLMTESCLFYCSNYSQFEPATRATTALFQTLRQLLQILTAGRWNEQGNPRHIRVFLCIFPDACLVSCICISLIRVPTKVKAGNEEHRLLECNIMQYGRNSSKIRRNIFPQVSELKIETSKHPDYTNYTASDPKR